MKKLCKVKFVSTRVPTIHAEIKMGTKLKKLKDRN